MLSFEEDTPKLTPVHKQNLNHIAKRLLEMAEMVHAKPFDPKIATHLRMASDLATEQVTLGKYYDYQERTGIQSNNKESDYKYLEQDDSIEGEEQESVKEAPPTPNTNLVDDDIHKWLDGLSED